MPGDYVIETQDLEKEYRHEFFTWLVRARALRGLTFSVGRGEVFGLLGPNGSGKTTAIKLLLGLIFPTRGQAAVFGRRPGDLAVKRRIGFLPEESYLYQFLDAEETLDFYGRLFNLDRRERRKRTDMLLDLTGLRKERRRPVAHFSKGMQRRIGIAQSLINDPDLVILDEPTAGLDPLGTREVKDIIVQLREKGKTVLLSSHLLADVEDVCDRVAILYGGKLQALGALGELLHDNRLTQVTAEMDAGTVEEVKVLIRKRMGNATEIGVAPPAERLEQFFLRVVSEARARREDTSGAAASTGGLAFLTGSRTEESLLDKLASGDLEASSASETEARPALPAADSGRALLASLAGENKPEAVSSAAPAREETPPDRGLLEKLSGKED